VVDSRRVDCIDIRGRFGRLVFAAVVAGGTLSGAPDPAQAADEGTVYSTTAVARKSPWVQAGAPGRLDFGFADFEASLDEKGDWSVKGPVRHGYLACATYQVGVRFGTGEPGCTNVEWLTPPLYATSERHCNHAGRDHAGGGTNPELAADFARITCAQRLIRCTGRCR
jgi:hypothetical protein